MKPKLSLQIAATIMLLHAIGHTMGALSWKKAPNAAVGQVISGMETTHFNFKGHSISLGNFFEGYGMTMIFVLLMVSLFLWLFSGETSNPLTGKLLAPLILFLVILAVLEYIYFFPSAAVFSLLAAIFACAARIVSKRAVMERTAVG